MLDIKVANLWVNRLIVDAQPDVHRKYIHRLNRSMAPIPFYCPQDSLSQSGA
jgi:hypothetical protein